MRDVTLSNSTFGNRYVHLAAPHLGVHALGGGIGQGVAMAIGAALAGAPAKTIALIGDGGAMVNLGELATAADAKADIVFVLMNDRGYGVIRNIQDAQFGGRRHYADLHTPDFGLLAAALGLAHQRVSRIAEFETSIGSRVGGQRSADSSKSTWSRSAPSRNPLPARRRERREAHETWHGDECGPGEARASAPARRGRRFAQPHHR